MFAVSAYRNPLNQSFSLLLSLDASNMRELYEIRMLLEGELAALAAERRSDEDLGRMLTALQEMREGLDSESRYIDADLGFHLAIADATQQPLRPPHDAGPARVVSSRALPPPTTPPISSRGARAARVDSRCDHGRKRPTRARRGACTSTWLHVERDIERTLAH